MPLLFAGLLIAGLPAAAQAAGSEGSLLSGYGGPGAGEQVILGSQLLHSRHHGGGGGSGEQGSTEESTGGAGESHSSQASPQGSSSTPSQPGTPGAARAGAGETSGGASSAATQHPHGGSGGTPANGSPLRGGTQTAVVAAEPLGLSSADIVLVIAVVCALASLGVLTRFAARGEQ